MPVEQVDFAPVASEFMQDTAGHKFIVGPVGSGKTIACIYNLFLLALNQKPAPDGYRYTRFIICRQTLSQLKQTVLKDILLFLEGLVSWKVSESTIYMHFDDVKCEMLCLPLDTPEDQKRLLSTQVTAVYFNEFVEINPELVVAAYGRTGRFPPKKMGGCTWHGVLGDSNPGTEDSPWYDLLVKDLPKGWSYHHQPEPIKDIGEFEEAEYVITDDAENVKNLPDTYYQDLLAGATENWSDRYVFGRWTPSLSGQAVFKGTFQPKIHISTTELQATRQMPLIMGMDTGRHPAAVVGQMGADGRLLILGEQAADNMGIVKFIRELVKPMLYQMRYQGCPVIAVVDPAGKQKSQIGEQSVIDAIKAEGFDAHLAPTNHIDPRIRAVEKYMLELRTSGPAFQIDLVHCPRLIHALRAGYYYKVQKSDNELKETPEKNHPASDLADALQYLCLGAGRHVLGRVMRRHGRQPEQIPSTRAWT